MTPPRGCTVLLKLLAQVRLKRHYNVVTSDVRFEHLPLSAEAKAHLEASRGGDG